MCAQDLGLAAGGRVHSEGGTAGGAEERQTFHLCHWQRRYREVQDPALLE